MPLGLRALSNRGSGANCPSTKTGGLGVKVGQCCKTQGQVGRSSLEGVMVQIMIYRCTVHKIKKHLGDPQDSCLSLCFVYIIGGSLNCMALTCVFVGWGRHSRLEGFNPLEKFFSPFILPLRRLFLRTFSLCQVNVSIFSSSIVISGFSIFNI